jgi:hypothetical protein
LADGNLLLENNSGSITAAAFEPSGKINRQDTIKNALAETSFKFIGSNSGASLEIDGKALSDFAQIEAIQNLSFGRHSIRWNIQRLDLSQPAAMDWLLIGPSGGNADTKKQISITLRKDIPKAGLKVNRHLVISLDSSYRPTYVIKP